MYINLGILNAVVSIEHDTRRLNNMSIAVKKDDKILIIVESP